MGTAVIETIQFIHRCDTCGLVVTVGDSDPPDGWCGVGRRNVETDLYDLELCAACTDIAALVMINSKQLASNESLPWSPSDYYVGNVAIAASWDNAKCPECKEPWSKGDPLRHSDKLGKWVHDSCA